MPNLHDSAFDRYADLPPGMRPGDEDADGRYAPSRSCSFSESEDYERPEVPAMSDAFYEEVTRREYLAAKARLAKDSATVPSIFRKAR